MPINISRSLWRENMNINLEGAYVTQASTSLSGMALPVVGNVIISPDCHWLTAAIKLTTA